MQLEADALIRGERSGLDPRGETIGGGRLNGNIVADARETDVGLSIKYQPHGTIAGVFLLSIHTDLNIAESFRKKPGETATGTFDSNPPSHKTEPCGPCRSARPAKRTAWSQTWLASAIRLSVIKASTGERILQGKT